MTVLATGEAPTAEGARTLSSWRLALFARMWAIAALFHLAGNARDALVTSPALALASVLMGMAAALVLLMPYRAWPLTLLCALVPTTAWFEAPVVGNHWVLAALISFGLLLSTLVARHQGSSRRPDPVWRAFAPAARTTLLAAYGFAAFAKLNSDFLDPTVSCAIYYHNQLVTSWGLQVLELSGSASLAQVVPVAAALTELAIALTLALPRTRRFGLMLAATFHWLLAMDLYQHFWDFSAVLFALFVLFLDDSQAVQFRRWTTRVLGRAPLRPAVRLFFIAAVSAVAVALNVLPVPVTFDVLLLVLGHLAWWSYGTSVAVVLVLLARARHAGPLPRRSGLRSPAAFLYVLPALAVLNGLTPYLEIKTGFGWNMYSNLRTVTGDSNHLLLPATLSLTGVQADRVRILDSSDAALTKLAEADYELPYKEFQTYAQAHPDVSVTYERAGQVHRVQRLADDPAADGHVGGLSRRLQPFRPIDVSGSERCRPGIELAR